MTFYIALCFGIVILSAVISGCTTTSQSAQPSTVKASDLQNSPAADQTTVQYLRQSDNDECLNLYGHVYGLSSNPAAGIDTIQVNLQNPNQNDMDLNQWNINVSSEATRNPDYRLMVAGTTYHLGAKTEIGTYTATVSDKNSQAVSILKSNEVAIFTLKVKPVPAKSIIYIQGIYAGKSCTFLGENTPGSIQSGINVLY
jgi:hypothetical protein